MHVFRATLLPPPPHHLLQGHEEFLIKQDCLQETEQRPLLLSRQHRKGTETPFQVQGCCGRREMQGQAELTTCLSVTSSFQRTPCSELAVGLGDTQHSGWFSTTRATTGKGDREAPSDTPGLTLPCLCSAKLDLEATTALL